MTTHDVTKNVADEKSSRVSRSSKKVGSTLIGLLALALIACGAVVYLVESYIGRIENLQHQPSVVVIDIGLLHLAKKQELQEQIPSYETVMREVDIFTHELDEILNAYSEAGIVVINKNATVVTPESLDVTMVLAERLQLHLPILTQ